MNFSIKKLYKSIYVSNVKVQWSRYVWNRHYIPKRRFVMWLVLQDGLKTKKRMMQIGVCTDARCYLCMQHDEDSRHLFLTVYLTAGAFKQLSAWLVSYGREGA